MKWLGQHIVDLIARFRGSVYLEGISSGTIASGGNLGLDSNNKIVKQSDTGITDLHGAGVDGADNQLLTDDGDGTVTSEAYLTFANSGNISTLSMVSNEDQGDLFTIRTTTHGLTTLTTTDDDAAAAHFEIAADGDITLEAAGDIALEPGGDITIYDTVNDGNPTISLGSSATNRLEIKSTYNSGTQSLCDVNFTTYTSSGTTNDGRMEFYVDEVLMFGIKDTGIITYGPVASNADGAYLSCLSSTTSSASQGAKLLLTCDDGAAMGEDHRLGVIEFQGAEDASNNRTIGARIEAKADAAWSASENGGRLEFWTSDGNAVEGLALTLDSDKLATFPGAVTATGALTGTLATASQPNVTTLAGATTVGTIGTGVWQGTAVASAYLDADTAHLSGSQIFTGIKSFAQIASAVFDGDKNVIPGDGGVIHVDTHDITDTNTSTSGTAAKYTHVNIENPRLNATNSSVTTTDAATLYVKGAPAAGTNQTITNAYAVYVDDGDVFIEDDLYLEGTLKFDSASLSTVQTSTESFADNDTSLMTSAAIDDKINTKYAYTYMTFSASGKPTNDGSDPEWMFPNSAKGIYDEDWTADSNITTTTLEASTALGKNHTANSIVLPHAGVLVGFHAIGRNDDSNLAFKAGLFYSDGAGTGDGLDYGHTGTTHEYTLECIASADTSGGVSGSSSYKGPCKLISNTVNKTIVAGDVILPAIMATADNATDEIFVTWTIILKIPLTT